MCDLSVLLCFRFSAKLEEKKKKEEERKQKEEQKQKEEEEKVISHSSTVKHVKRVQPFYPETIGGETSAVRISLFCAVVQS